MRRRMKSIKVVVRSKLQGAFNIILNRFLKIRTSGDFRPWGWGVKEEDETFKENVEGTKRHSPRYQGTLNRGITYSSAHRKIAHRPDKNQSFIDRI